MAPSLVKHVLIVNESPFDATIQVADASPNGRVFVLSPDLLAGKSWLYQLDSEGIPAGTEIKLQVVYELNTGRNDTVITYTHNASSWKAKYFVRGTVHKPEITYAGMVDPNELSFRFPTDAEIQQFNHQVTNTDIPAPEPSLTQKKHWLQCVVRNMTHVRIVLQNRHTHFNSGRYWHPPSDILPFDQMVFTCCEGDGTFGTGATGGTAFRLFLDPVTWFDVAIGWTNPVMGKIKAGILNSRDPEAGYDRATSDGNVVKSATKFKGMDCSGQPGEWQIEMTATPGRTIIYTLALIRVG